MPYSKSSESQIASNSLKPTKANLTSEEEFPKPRQKPNRFSKQPWKPILAAILLSVGAGLAWNVWLRPDGQPSSSQMSANQPQAVPVKLATVVQTPVEESSEYVGTLEARRTVTLKPEISGRVSQILVQEGDRVQSGTAIVRLDSNDLKSQLLQAQASLADAQARLAELQAGTRSEEVAQARAKLRQAQARLANTQQGARPEEIAQAQAELDSAEAEAALAKQRVGRYQLLQQEGAISIDQYQQYQQQERSATAAVTAAQRRLAELREGRRSDIDELAAAVEQEQQNLRQLENGARPEEIAQAQAQVAQAKAEVRTAEVQLQKTDLRAPFTGVVGDIPVKIGDYVSDGDDLTILTENNILELNLSIPLTNSSKLRLGLPVQILDAEGKGVATGKISFISPNVNDNSQVVLAKATFSNLQGELLNRQLVQARVIWERRTGILIPATAITRIGGEAFVFVAQPSEQSSPEQPSLVAKQKSVKLGAMQGNNYQVLEGLQPGDKIVIAGLLNLADGVPITVTGDQTSPPSPFLQERGAEGGERSNP